MIFTEKVHPSVCCASSAASQSSCPACGQEGITVSAVTVRSQLKKASLAGMLSPMDAFNFCTNPQCGTVYYSHDRRESFTQSAVKSKVAIKNSDPKTPLCYCRKLLKKDVVRMIETKKADIAGTIKSMISEGKSFCEKSNPKGVCCTEDIKSFLKDYDISWEEPKKMLFSLQQPSSCC